MRRLLYGPPNWVVTKFSSEDRRAFGFWTVVLAAVGALFFGRQDFDNGYSTPGTGLEVSHLNSGETSATITYGGASATTFASFAIELDSSVPQYDWVTTGKADSDAERVLQRPAMTSSYW